LSGFVNGKTWYFQGFLRGLGGNNGTSTACRNGQNKMLNLIGAKWEPIWIDFFGSGVQSTPDYRFDGALGIVNKRLTGRQFLVSDKPTIADDSMTAYLYYPAEEFGFDIAKDHPAIGAWLERMKALPGWKHPYDLMPGYPLGTRGYRNQ
jgi:glutathione S-transferase